MNKELKIEEVHAVMYEMLKNIDTLCKEHNIKYWLDYGTLLGCIRHKGFIPWDDDLDLGMMRSDYEKFLLLAQSKLPGAIELLHYSVQDDPSFYFIKLKYKNSKSYNATGITPWGISIDIFPYDRIRPNRIKYHNAVRRLISIVYQPNVNNYAVGIKRMLIYPVNLIGRKRVYDFFQSLFCSQSSSSNIVCGLELVSEKITNNYLMNEDVIFPLSKKTFIERGFPVPNDWDKYLTDLYGDYMKIPETPVTHDLIFMLINNTQIQLEDDIS